MMRAIYFTRFMPTCDAGGGSRRLMQMLELLEDFNCEVVSSARADRIEKKALARIQAGQGERLLARPALFMPHLNRWDESRRGVARRLHAFSRQWSRYLQQTTKPDLIFVDDPVYFQPLVETAGRLRIPVIAVCHNFESLVYNQAPQQQVLDLFRQELAVLSRCRMTITISREEALLLKNLGANALFLPYYPVRLILDRLLAVRKQRAAGEKHGIILIGNVKNPPTREGMIQVVRHWQQHDLARVAGPLMVGGFDTERIAAELAESRGIEFLGSLSNEQLDSILCRVKACLCYQERGAGALTKICEMLVAGVPVVANTVAARSYHGMAGIVEFNDLDRLRSSFRAA